jgi:hypothetical protein
MFIAKLAQGWGGSGRKLTNTNDLVGLSHLFQDTAEPIVAWTATTMLSRLCSTWNGSASNAFWKKLELGNTFLVERPRGMKPSRSKSPELGLPFEASKKAIVSTESTAGDFLEGQERHSNYCMGLVGLPGFEPGTSCTPSKRASQAAPQPEFSLFYRMQPSERKFLAVNLPPLQQLRTSPRLHFSIPALSFKQRWLARSSASSQTARG